MFFSVTCHLLYYTSATTFIYSIHFFSPLKMTSPSELIMLYLFTSAVFNTNYIGNTKFSKPIEENEVWDFIVIGGGAAGSLVAARLSESPKFKVLLLERAGSGNDYTDIPLLNNQFQELPKGYHGFGLTKNYNTTKSEYTCGGNGGICVLLQGNSLGGGSNFNGLYSRGSPLDYNTWETQFGAKGWSYKDVLPFFEATEKCVNQTLVADGYHGTKGEQYLSDTFTFPMFTTMVQSAVEESGFKVGHDYDDPQFTDTFGSAQSYNRKGQVYNSRRAFLVPALRRKNLKVLCFAEVTKILFQGKKATGVQYFKDGKFQEAKVSKEVILSAGSIGSPKILMLSGIGDKEQLSKLDIPMVMNLPAVGKSLTDQSGTVLSFNVNRPLILPLTYNDLQQYWHKKVGKLTKKPVVYTGYLTIEPYSKNSNDTRGQLTFSVNPIPKGRKTGSFDLQVNTLVPKSRGFIKLVSKDPLDDPIVNPNYFKEGEDREIFKKTLKIGIKIIQSNALKPWNPTLPPKPSPCGLITIENLKSDSFLDCFIQQIAAAIFHPTSTCKMGSGEKSKTTVVDPQLRVIGIENVRVVDASIMPHIVRGNMNGPSTMIGAKGASMIIMENS